MSTPGLGYLLKKFPRLSETFILNEMLVLEELGLPLHVFSRCAPDDEPRHPQIERLAARVEELPALRQLDPWSVLFAPQRAEKPLLDSVREVVAEAGDWSHPRFPSLLAEALFLLGRCQELGIGHLHVHFATDSAIVARLVRRLGGPSFSLTAHAKDLYRDGVDFNLLDGLFRESSFVVTVCDANIQHLRHRLGKEAAAKVRRLYNGIRLEDFPFVGEPGARDQDHVLAVGRLVEKKGFHLLIAALARLQRSRSTVRATVVGEGEERERLLGLVAEHDLADSVRFVGPLHLAEVSRLMSQATVLCLPCIVGKDGNRDALPTVLLEALASGLPVISTPLTGIPEILDGGRAGALVDTGNVEALAGAIAQLLAEPERRRELARRGRERVERLFESRRSVVTLAGWLSAVLVTEPRSAAARFGRPPPRPAGRRDLRPEPKVALVNPDPGIAPGRQKGAAVHLDAMARAFRQLGAWVVRIDEPDPDRLRRRLEQESAGGCDLVYERYALGSTTAQQVCSERDIPHVLEVNAPLVEEQRRYHGASETAAQRDRDHALFCHCECVIAVSSEVAAYARVRGAAPQRVHVFANGVDSALFRPRPPDDPWRRRLVPEGQVAVGFHGRLRPWHGFDGVAQAVGKLHRQGLPLHLIVVGQGDFDSILRDTVPDGAWTRVDWVAHEEVARYVAAFDLLPLGFAPQGESYFSPLKLAEAMACGVVPIVPRVGDLPEIVRHGVDGLVYPTEDSVKLESGLRRLVEDRALRQRLGTSARARAERLSWTRIASFALARTKDGAVPRTDDGAAPMTERPR